MYKLNSYLPNNRFLASVLIATTLVLSSSAHALKDDIEKPVHINADSVLFNKTKGLGVYEGNVSIVQGSLDIRAAKIEITAPGGQITTITASGSPVKFQQKMDDGKLAKGQANRVVYQVSNKRIVLDGNAAITQNNDRFASNHIEYSTSNGELKAGNKKAAGKSRVKAVFYPTNKSKK
ncbi:MAG: lipopolysaccharide transport periplasmic protein LptA [Cocleimonas sp.]